MLGNGGWILQASPLATPRQALLDVGCQMINEKGTRAEGRVTNDKIIIFGGIYVF